MENGFSLLVLPVKIDVGYAAGSLPTRAGKLTSAQSTLGGVGVMQRGSFWGFGGQLWASRRVAQDTFAILRIALLGLAIIGLSDPLGVRAAISDESASGIATTDVVTAAPPVGTRWLLVSSFQCFIAAFLLAGVGK